jgi:hypothetical protein
MKHTYSGKSLKELKEEYGTGGSGFYKQDWYESKSFWTEKPKAGTYKIDLGEKLTDLTFKEQKKRLKKGYKPIHPAILAEFILSHFKKTGERLLKDKYARTESTPWDGFRVCLGDFDADGLGVSYSWGGNRDDGLGLASARELRTSKTLKLDASDSLNSKLESAIKIVKENGYKVIKEL